MVTLANQQVNQRTRIVKGFSQSENGSLIQMRSLLVTLISHRGYLAKGKLFLRAYVPSADIDLDIIKNSYCTDVHCQNVG